jgi:hypothetical protein
MGLTDKGKGFVLDFLSAIKNLNDKWKTIRFFVR